MQKTRLQMGNSPVNGVLPNGWALNTKEELLYYRSFCEHFGELKDLPGWAGQRMRLNSDIMKELIEQYLMPLFSYFFF